MPHREPDHARKFGRSSSMGQPSRKLMSARTFQFAVAGAILAGTLIAQTHAIEARKDYHFNVGPRAGVSVNNPYGSISVKPWTGNVVTINALLASDKVEVDNN